MNKFYSIFLTYFFLTKYHPLTYYTGITGTPYISEDVAHITMHPVIEAYP